MSSELSREIRKLDVRLEDYTKADQEFVEHVKGYAKTLYRRVWRREGNLLAPTKLNNCQD